MNFSELNGTLSKKIAKKLKGGGHEFFATGVSLVIHPKNPFVPTVHMVKQHIERGGIKWFGGAKLDLTPLSKYKKYHTIYKALKEFVINMKLQTMKNIKQNVINIFTSSNRNEARCRWNIF